MRDGALNHRSEADSERHPHIKAFHHLPQHSFIFARCGVSAQLKMLQRRIRASRIDGAKKQKVGPESQERLSREAYRACDASMV
jgi:hypothetical protein